MFHTSQAIPEKDNMKSRIKYEAVATIGKYKDKQTGEDRKQFLKVGTVFESEDGRLSLKLDAVPCSPEWSGFISFYEPKRDAGPGQAHEQRRQSAGMPAAPAATNDHEDEDLPF